MIKTLIIATLAFLMGFFAIGSIALAQNETTPQDQQTQQTPQGAPQTGF